MHAIIRSDILTTAAIKIETWWCRSVADPVKHPSCVSRPPLPQLFPSSFCITTKLNYVVATTDREYQFRWGWRMGSAGSKILLPSKIDSDRSLACPLLSCAAIIPLASPLSNPTLRCTSICHSTFPSSTFLFSSERWPRLLGRLPDTHLLYWRVTRKP